MILLVFFKLYYSQWNALLVFVIFIHICLLVVFEKVSKVCHCPYWFGSDKMGDLLSVSEYVFECISVQVLTLYSVFFFFLFLLVYGAKHT